jgi:hypothetical protein
MHLTQTFGQRIHVPQGNGLTEEAPVIRFRNARFAVAHEIEGKTLSPKV